MNRAEWQAFRMLALTSQEGACAHSGCLTPAQDVVTGADGMLVAYCRSHRLKLDGAARAVKGRHTKLVNREHESGQTTIEGS
jgi:hypothetical protein